MAYIKGFLNNKEIDSYQKDLRIAVILELYSSTSVAIGITFSTRD
jgi:hypothetical protein